MNLRVVIVLAHPVIPDATQKIWEQLGQAGKVERRSNRSIGNGADWSRELESEKPEAVFPRADKKEVSERIETMENEIRNPGARSARFK